MPAIWALAAAPGSPAAFALETAKAAAAAASEAASGIGTGVVVTVSGPREAMRAKMMAAENDFIFACGIYG